MNVFVIIFGCFNTKTVIQDPSVEEEISFDADGDGYYIEDDCNDNDATVHTGATEICDEIDNNCNGAIDEGVAQMFFFDNDGDGFGDNDNYIEACEAAEGTVLISGDCDDNNDQIYPAAAEICDQQDNDCNNQIDDGVGDPLFEDNDNDGFGNPEVVVLSCTEEDGFVSNSQDCNDSSSNGFTVNPDAEELCDDIDNNCDGNIDEGIGSIFYVDSDGDGFGSATQSVISCFTPDGYADNTEDCDDLDSEVNPNAVEICDSIDNNCDDLIDEYNEETASGYTLYLDADGDGFGNAEQSLFSCNLIEGYSLSADDCDDSPQGINTYPSAPEICDGLDNDCDSLVDNEPIDPAVYFIDLDQDGFGSTLSTITTCSTPLGYAANDSDCNDDPNQNGAQFNPNSSETCDLLDNDCDGLIDALDSDLIDGILVYEDNDEDGFGSSAQPFTACSVDSGFSTEGMDCDDSNNAVHPNHPEVCDDLDNDCNEQIDDNVGEAFYYDFDQDGFGLTHMPLYACEAPIGYASEPQDCDDNNPNIHPQAEELCNNLDDDCDGIDDLDEGLYQTWFLDYDMDGFGVEDSSVMACQQPAPTYALEYGDCEPQNPDIHPLAQEVCDDIDHNCDGLIDFDADEDLSSDFSCGGSDCDDSDPNLTPGLYGGCPLGDTCLDVLNNGYTSNGTYTIDPDGLSIGEDPFEVYCDMLTDGGGWTLIYNDDFSVTPSGWNNNTISSCGTLGSILGGYNVLGAGDTLTQSFSALPEHTSVRVSYDFIRIDSWDWGETAYFYLDALPIWSDTGFSDSGTNICGNSAHPYWLDENWSVEMTSVHSAHSLSLLFSSSLDQEADDESWGIDNLWVWIR